MRSRGQNCRLESTSRVRIQEKKNSDSKQFKRIKKKEITTANEKKANKEYRTQNKIHKTSKTNKVNR